MEEEAAVPELRLVTGRLPVTPPVPEEARFVAEQINGTPVVVVLQRGPVAREERAVALI